MTAPKIIAAFVKLPENEQGTLLMDLHDAFYNPTYTPLRTEVPLPGKKNPAKKKVK
jgi:hypothetical protein